MAIFSSYSAEDVAAIKEVFEDSVPIYGDWFHYKAVDFTAKVHFFSITIF